MNDVLKLFDSSQKWVAFRGLANLSDEIKRHWYNKLREALMAHFRNHENDRWNVFCVKEGIDDMRWYLKEFDEESACVCLEKERFSIWVNGAFYDYVKAMEIFKSPKYYLIHSIFRKDIWCNSSYLIAENGNFHFDSDSIERYDYDSLAWHAGNRTEEFCQQIVEKIEMITSNPTLTNLMFELNSQIRKN